MKDEINILLVDDEHSLLDQAKIFLEREGNLNVITASSAKEGLELLDKEDFDVIVSDYQMPEMDGLDFLEEIRNKREIDITFIMFTGKGREEVAMDALNLGADRYLRKGGDPKSQFEVLANAIKQEREHKETKMELKKKNITLSSIFKHLPIIVMVVDRNRRVKMINRTGLKFANKSEEEILNQRGGEALRCLNRLEDPDGCGYSEKCEECIVKNSVLDTFETREKHYREKGTLPFEAGEGKNEVSFWVTTAPLEFEEKERVLVAIEDITELENTKKRLQESREKYQSLFEQSMDAIYLHDRKGNILEVNERACEQSGYDRQELLEMNVFDFHPEQLDGINLPKEEILAQWEEWEAGIKHTIEAEHQRKDETIYPVQMVTGVVEYGDEELIMALVRDMTEQVKKERELKTRQERLETEREKRKTLLDNIPGYALILKKDSREIVFSNEKAKEIGAAPGETCYETVPERDFPCPFCKASELWETEERREIEVKYDGRYYYGIWIPYTEDLYVHYIFDITERKKADIRIRKTKEKLEKLQQASADLETCQSKEDVYTLAIEVAEDILEFEWCVINTPEKDRLVTKKTSGNYPDEEPSYLLIEDSVAGRAFLENESYLDSSIDELEEASPTNDDYRSGITVPIGKFGVFQAISSEEDDFDEDDLTMTELLMDHVNEALNMILRRKWNL